MAVDGEDAELVVLADEIRARHYEACAVEGEGGQDVADLGVVGCGHGGGAVVKGVG